MLAFRVDEQIAVACADRTVASIDSCGQQVWKDHGHFNLSAMAIGFVNLGFVGSHRDVVMMWAEPHRAR